MAKRPPTPAGPRRGESVADWYFGLGGPARYRVTIDDVDVPRPLTVWAMSPGAALDAAIISVDAREKVNVRGATAHVDEIARDPDPEDLKATDAGWPFAPPPRVPRFDRDDLVSAVIFVALIARGGIAVALFAFAVLAGLDAEWLRAAIAAGIATLISAALAALLLS